MAAQQPANLKLITALIGFPLPQYPDNDLANRHIAIVNPYPANVYTCTTIVSTYNGIVMRNKANVMHYNIDMFKNTALYLNTMAM